MHAASDFASQKLDCNSTTAPAPTETAVIDQAIGEQYAAYNCDCVEGIRKLADQSIHHAVFSPPFSSLYTYSASERDMGNCRTSEEFFEHFRFLAEELLRVLKPGRVVALHCMELPELKSRVGHIGVEDFPGDLVRCMKAAGFIYDGRCTIWKDPVTAMQRTKSIRLLHKQLCKDSAMSGWALADYVLKFKKPGVNPEPVAGELDYFCGDASTFTATGRLSIDIWQRYASPIWTDINPSNTLQYTTARDEDDERHICPLQLDVIERCLQLWSNPGDTILSPFAGIGSEGYVAVKMGRRFIGFELKPSYFKVAVRNMEAAELAAKQGRLF